MYTAAVLPPTRNVNAMQFIPKTHGWFPSPHWKSSLSFLVNQALLWNPKYSVLFVSVTFGITFYRRRKYYPSPWRNHLIYINEQIGHWHANIAVLCCFRLLGMSECVLQKLYSAIKKFSQHWTSVRDFTALFMHAHFHSLHSTSWWWCVWYAGLHPLFSKSFSSST